jgi:hypothetical protein
MSAKILKIKLKQISDCYLVLPKANAFGCQLILPKPILLVASSFHSLSPASAISSYPKPFKRMLRILLAFLVLVILHKRACDAALNQKSLSLS